MAAILADSAVQSPAPAAERVVISNFKGEKLVGVLFDTGSPEIYILCHGLRSNKEFTGIKVLSNALVQAGLSTFRFDFSGNGESEGEFSYGGYWQEVEDLRAVILHWRSKSRIVNCIIGHSKGGNAVLLYASKYADVPVVINCSGRGSLKEGLDSRLGSDYKERMDREGFVLVKERDGNAHFKVTKEDLSKRLSIDMFETVEKIPTSLRVLTVHGADDEAVDVKDAYEFDKHIPNHTLKIVDGGDHVYSAHHAELTRCVLDFIGSFQGRALM